jgi:hypothetical protein
MNPMNEIDRFLLVTEALSKQRGRRTDVLTREREALKRKRHRMTWSWSADIQHDLGMVDVQVMAISVVLRERELASGDDTSE